MPRGMQSSQWSYNIHTMYILQVCRRKKHGIYTRNIVMPSHRCRQHIIEEYAVSIREIKLSDIDRADLYIFTLQFSIIAEKHMIEIEHCAYNHMKQHFKASQERQPANCMLIHEFISNAMTYMYCRTLAINVSTNMENRHTHDQFSKRCLFSILGIPTLTPYY